METSEKERIREAVRGRYGEIARSRGIVAGESNQTESCCGPTQISPEPSQAVSCCGSSNASSETSRTASCGCSGSNFSPEKMSALMGYTNKDIDSIPDGANMGLGCGNPVALASLIPGETVLDLGSGGGFDCFLAAKEVGKTGKIIGVDMTPDMISKARKNAKKMKASNVEFRLGEIEHLPVADNSVNIIMSNCVINLSPDKLSVYQEAYRVLKPGGRLAISDIVATAALPDEIKKNLLLVTACVGGAETIHDTEKMLKKVGFQDIKITPNDNSRDLIREWDPDKSENVGDYVVSAYIEGVKPS